MSYIMGERVVGFVEHIFSYGKRLSAMDACVVFVKPAPAPGVLLRRPGQS